MPPAESAPARCAGSGRCEGASVRGTPRHRSPLEPRSLTRQCKAALQRAGLPDIRIHDLRHTAASLLVAQGTHPRVIMEILGHSQISLTMNTYTHVLPEAQREATALMDVLFPAIAQ